jgi:sulfur-carrier protein adenylyltransferase/sulfurtransferase
VVQSKLKILFPDEAKDFINSREEGSYTLMDVRQPSEYEEGHLPGAMLVPLPELVDALTRLDHSGTFVLYCAAGGRSRAAAQLMIHQGFQDVYQLEGGTYAWEDPMATGPAEFHMKFMRGDETPEEIIRLAYAMEEGVKRLHKAMKDRTGDTALATLLERLIKAEEAHERALLTLVSDPEVSGRIEKEVSAAPSDLMEGGFSIEQFMKENESRLNTVEGYLDIAMMIETQALDLYLQMAAAVDDEKSRHVLQRIGDEEKAHLSLLGRYLDGLP